jgi:hypothetical protein
MAKNEYDRNAKLTPYNVGDAVMMLHPAHEKTSSPRGWALLQRTT